MIEFFEGSPVSQRNQIIQGDDFYVSYLGMDTIYGSDTTALVKTEKENPVLFLLLNGDHRKEYTKLLKEGFYSCVKYYLEKEPTQRNKFSESSRKEFNEILSYMEKENV